MKKKNFQIFSLFQTCDKTTCMVVMSMKASNKIFTFITSCSVVQALGLLQYGHIMNMFQIIGNLLYPNIYIYIYIV